MKKFIVLILALGAMVTSFTACGNENIGFGNYNFTHIHISNGANGYCATVTSWRDNDIGIEAKTSEYGSIYCAEGTYILFEDNRCPFCND